MPAIVVGAGAVGGSDNDRVPPVTGGWVKRLARMERCHAMELKLHLAQASFRPSTMAVRIMSQHLRQPRFAHPDRHHEIIQKLSRHCPMSESGQRHEVTPGGKSRWLPPAGLLHQAHRSAHAPERPA